MHIKHEARCHKEDNVKGTDQPGSERPFHGEQGTGQLYR